MSEITGKDLADYQLDERSRLINFIGLIILGVTAIVIQIATRPNSSINKNEFLTILSVELIAVMGLLATKYLYMTFFRNWSIRGKPNNLINILSIIMAYISVALCFSGVIYSLYAFFGGSWQVILTLIVFLLLYICSAVFELIDLQCSFK